MKQKDPILLSIYCSDAGKTNKKTKLVLFYYLNEDFFFLFLIEKIRKV